VRQAQLRLVHCCSTASRLAAAPGALAAVARLAQRDLRRPVHAEEPHVLLRRVVASVDEQPRAVLRLEDDQRALALARQTRVVKEAVSHHEAVGRHIEERAAERGRDGAVQPEGAVRGAVGAPVLGLDAIDTAQLADDNLTQMRVAALAPGAVPRRAPRSRSSPAARRGSPSRWPTSSNTRRPHIHICDITHGCM